MSLKQFTIDFQELRKDSFLRNDEKYHIFLNFLNWNLFESKNKNLVSLKDILVDDYNLFNYEEGEEYKGIPTGQTYLDKDGEIKGHQSVTAEDHPNRLKHKASNDNILISSLRLAKSPTLYFKNKDLSNYVFSNGFYIYKIKKGWNIKFILYILRTKRLRNILDKHIYRGIGISAYKDSDLKKIKIPLISKHIQDQIVVKIEPIERKIKEMKNQIIPAQKIINKVFAREFGFDLEKFEELEKENFFEAGFSEINNDPLLIFKVKYHKYNIDFLEKIKTIKLKKISDFIKAGNAEKYKEVAEEGNYISVEDLNSDGGIMSYKFSNSKNAILKIRDILFSRVGSKLDSADIPIGIIKNDFQKFASDNILIIRLSRFNNDFVMYFLKSVFGNKQIRKVVKTKGQPVINSTTLGNIKIPNIPLKNQQKIVDEIKTELDKQEKMNQKIETERNKIDEIIEKVVAV
ncbi:restriction endonuclease subunit S [Patescibacteria group bacterium]|nr:restriction endonuclease subunit S [Patescibacteria group bacterium]